MYTVKVYDAQGHHMASIGASSQREAEQIREVQLNQGRKVLTIPASR